MLKQKHPRRAAEEALDPRDSELGSWLELSRSLDARRVALDVQHAGDPVGELGGDRDAAAATAATAVHPNTLHVQAAVVESVLACDLVLAAADLEEDVVTVCEHHLHELTHGLGLFGGGSRDAAAQVAGGNLCRFQGFPLCVS